MVLISISYIIIGPCLLAPHVDTCPTSALFHKPNLERVANIRSRDHLVRYYNQIGQCVFHPQARTILTMVDFFSPFRWSMCFFCPSQLLQACT